MFMAFGTLTWDYAWFLFVVGLAATVVGQFGECAAAVVMYVCNTHCVCSKLFLFFANNAPQSIFLSTQSQSQHLPLHLHLHLSPAGVSYLVQKYQRASLVSLSIGAVVAISTVLMAMQVCWGGGVLLALLRFLPFFLVVYLLVCTVKAILF